jgi:hypothetical protein
VKQSIEAMKMKVINPLIVFALLSTCYIYFGCKKDNSPPSSNVHLEKGLLVYLPFNGSLADSSGNANSVTSAGMTLTYDEHGNPNHAVQGTGNGERIMVSNNGSIKFDTAFTFSVNCMLRSVRTQVIASMVNNSDGTGFTFETSTNIPNSAVADFAVGKADVACDATGGSSTTDTSQFALQPESWYNIVSVYHKGVLQLYVNGTLVSTKTGGAPTARICQDAKLIIGGWWQNDPLSINGKIDQVRLYDRVLNGDEIAELSKQFQ